MKQTRYFIEAALIHLLFCIFRILPPAASSALGGWIGRTIGPRLAASRKAARHLAASLPHIADTGAVITGMWDNLGRTMAEYPHLKRLIENHTEIHGYLPDGQKQFVFFSGHLANWEMSATGMAHFFAIAPQLVYRAPNNPYLQDLLDRSRSLKGEIGTIPKSQRGARDIVRALQKGESLGILIDQKYNEGIAAEFFGQTAMTSAAFAQLAQKFDVPLIPVRPERVKGCQFRITVYPPIPTQGRVIEDIVTDAHRLLEQWITERPDQWLWLHRRWDSARGAIEDDR